MVFLRPVVIRDAAQSDTLTLDRYDLMRTKQQNQQPAPSAILRGVEGAPVMPAVPPPLPPAKDVNSPFNPPAPASTAPSVR